METGEAGYSPSSWKNSMPATAQQNNYPEGRAMPPRVLAEPRTKKFSLVDLILRISAGVLSVVAFSVAAAEHAFLDLASGKGVVAANVLVFLYCLAYIFLAVTRIQLISSPVSEWVCFISDQLLAYLLLSTFAAGAGVIDSTCSNSSNSFCSKAAGSVSMAFLAFIAVAASAIISGFNLSKQILKP